MKTGTKLLIVIFIILLIVVAGLLVYKFVIEKNNVEEENIVSLGSDTISNEKKMGQAEIFAGNSRPIAVMIDNHKSAQPQAGLNEAFLVYEIIVEGGESRLMALFKGKDVARIGPVRSSRHYFIDYAIENDAIYTHYGWSPKAENDIKSLKVNNINGISESDKVFKRASGKSSPHNVVVSSSALLDIAKNKNYKTTSDSKSLLNYTTKEVDLTDGTIANDISIPYSQSNTVKYKYNEETKRYERYSKGAKQTDWDTKEVISTKNIIITYVKNSKLPDTEDKDRQDIENLGSKDGYYITNGKVIKITCEKTSRQSKTKYKDINGNEIEINDGNTYIQICPIDANVTIE